MKTIVWDVDDVLNDFMRRWFEDSWLPSHPGCKLRYADIAENPPHRLLGVSEKDYLDSLDKFRLSEAAVKMLPAPQVVEWFKANGGNFRHIALTARPIGAIPPVSEWVFRHFGIWIRTFHFVPSLRPGQQIPEYDHNKCDYLRWLGKVDVLVDDNEKNIDEAGSLGIAGVLIKRPWNKSNSSIDEALSLLNRI
ncbi:MAG: hypothetical protein COS99_06340 [Candidatus Omnitrophica bacterium CG07_land_8_20_14_0_80_42_15]|uniref:Magnesium-dependent phosphatase-1 n=1 Tax=Candidatus Aquitaenariimonas noxiae TaxID=1974741 RepID=A0A2J0KTZ7_9BACT|nr:MAG: hypothetical protein COS99_06340 [Candidatus Omnitrophica bacterium CG07_land_8_20_14_0_80_42_15]